MTKRKPKLDDLPDRRCKNAVELLRWLRTLASCNLNLVGLPNMPEIRRAAHDLMDCNLAGIVPGIGKEEIISTCWTPEELKAVIVTAMDEFLDRQAEEQAEEEDE